ncbi:hypothetical protein KDH_31480 [Dictyobacter sp. S3.2.2.5]|uniref:Uncharacterized protein n=1 Tax=Dictyobacter halimunensis TaxID=3026934 RepID=A0ABQ6FPW1_9CHLR|nr:hypothetical protein KDH_31480 [Dictyobacter sp. S3.2.2.5]
MFAAGVEWLWIHQRTIKRFKTDPYQYACGCESKRDSNVQARNFTIGCFSDPGPAYSGKSARQGICCFRHARRGV